MEAIKRAYEYFKNILREYINVDYLGDKVKELYGLYEKKDQVKTAPDEKTAA